VLIAVASKNELTVVEAALQREDMLVPGKLLFPVCANWGPKSGSIAEILRIWNIGADSVVFVDDSAMELEEVRTAFPAMTCLQFSKQPLGCWRCSNNCAISSASLRSTGRCVAPGQHPRECVRLGRGRFQQGRVLAQLTGQAYI